MPKKLVQIGWREWIGLPSLGIERIAAKVDTGARTSALHAREITWVEPGFVEFTAPLLRRQRFVGEWQRHGIRRVRAPLVEERHVRCSSGEEELRPIIRIPILVSGLEFECEFSLTTRDQLRFPVLLGRTALRGRFVVDASRPSRAPRGDRSEPEGGSE